MEGMDRMDGIDGMDRMDGMDDVGVFQKRSSVVVRQIAGETFLVPVRGELAQLHRLFALNPVGAFIWQQLDGIRDLEQIHRHVVERFEVDAAMARRDLLDYVHRLREAQLIDSLECP